MLNDLVFKKLSVSMQHAKKYLWNKLGGKFLSKICSFLPLPSETNWIYPLRLTLRIYIPLFTQTPYATSNTIQCKCYWSTMSKTRGLKPTFQELVRKKGRVENPVNILVNKQELCHCVKKPSCGTRSSRIL